MDRPDENNPCELQGVCGKERRDGDTSDLHRHHLPPLHVRTRGGPDKTGEQSLTHQSPRQLSVSLLAARHS